MSNIDHKTVMAECAKLLKTHGVNIKGKGYTMVKDRIEIFRRHYGLDLGIKTNIHTYNEKVVVVEASVIDANGKCIGDGKCEEFRSSSKINQSSALMNCETGAIGRALANCGLSGTEFASAEEMVAALTKQESKVVANLIKEKESNEDTLTVAPLQDDLVKIKDTFPNSSIVEKEPTTRDHDPIDDFHPKQNWSAWFDIQMSTIVKFQYKAELRKYFESNKKVFTEYKEQDAKKCGILMDLINKRNKELEI
tara:strand:+ start:319 stop:1071 length:753 start_codon:yes stop_codon:yes gene_type:complete